jgi:hypothetical protein
MNLHIYYASALKKLLAYQEGLLNFIFLCKTSLLGPILLASLANKKSFISTQLIIQSVFWTHFGSIMKTCFAQWWWAYNSHKTNYKSPYRKRGKKQGLANVSVDEFRLRVSQRNIAFFWIDCHENTFKLLAYMVHTAPKHLYRKLFWQMRIQWPCV